jgi:hypothetical protein
MDNISYRILEIAYLHQNAQISEQFITSTEVLGASLLDYELSEIKVKFEKLRVAKLITRGIVNNGSSLVISLPGIDAYLKEKEYREKESERNELDNKLKKITISNIRFNKYFPFFALIIAVAIPLYINSVNSGNDEKQIKRMQELQELQEKNTQSIQQILQDFHVLDSLSRKR